MNDSRVHGVSGPGSSEEVALSGCLCAGVEGGSFTPSEHGD